MKGTSLVRFESVQEWNNTFLALFPHRFDYIFASYADPGETLAWQTESRHPLSDRLLQQGTYLYGVRFGSQTNYCLLDIDRGSPYHPQHDPLAIARIVAALEAIGLVDYVACTSSYSGGLHLYFPFQQPQSSWELASAVGTTVENAGFLLKAGQLELFPNPKPYIVDDAPSLFNAHRLPMQIGSYLLNEDFQPIWSNRHSFVQQWQLVQGRNDVQTQTIKRILKQAKRKHYRISGKADKFINDLNAEIEPGWTGYGQTNHLLGRITMRAYIFNHVIAGGAPLEGKALVEEIVNTAQALPGYFEWCQHQHEIEQRVEEWARCIENSHYFHYGDESGKYKTKLEPSEVDPAIATLPTWNQQQSEATRERIRKAIAELLENNTLPAGATARFRILTRYGIGGGSLYRHRDLWHPNYLVEPPPSPPAALEDNQFDCVEDTSNWDIPPSLLPLTDGDKPPRTTSGDRTLTDSLSAGSNTLPTGNVIPVVTPTAPASSSSPSSGSAQFSLLDSKTWLAVTQAATQEAQSRSQQIKQQAQQQKYVQRMQQYLHSGDPILAAEAIAWAQVNPDVFNHELLNLLPVLSPLQPQPPSCSSHCSTPQFPFDCSDLLVAISIELRRLGWSSTQSCSCLQRLLGKSSQALLDEFELQQWLDWLTQQQFSPDGL